MGSVDIEIRQVEPGRNFGGATTGFIAAIVVLLLGGSVILYLPVSSEPGESTGVLAAFFTAVSAFCVTGHVVFDTGSHWSGFGEAAVLLLIQVGGLGYMMGTIVAVWAIGRHLGLKDRQMLRLFYGAPDLRETVSFLKVIAIYAIAVEAAGALLLCLAFLVGGHSLGESAWWAVFHSIAAFNNAGFHLTGSNFIDYRDDPLVLVTLSVLVVLGSLGAVPVLIAAQRRSWSRLPLDTKLVFVTTVILLLAGSIAIYGFEFGTVATVGAAGDMRAPAMAAFESVMARSAGFSTVPVDAQADETKVVLMMLMFIGGGAGATAGGIKVGTFAILVVALFATFNGRDEAVVFRRRLPDSVVRQALAISLSALAFVVVLALALILASDAPVIDILFDSVAAFGTVGLSTGVAAGGGATERLLLAGAMLAGRFGPILLVLEMNRRHRKSTYRAVEDSIRFG